LSRHVSIPCAATHGNEQWGMMASGKRELAGAQPRRVKL
jgi:hypothetical protein